LPPTVHREPGLHTVTGRESPHLHQRAETTAISLRGKKLICTTVRTAQEGVFPAYCSLRKTARALGKKSSKTNSRGTME
jgi:hypothetical protein